MTILKWLIVLLLVGYLGGVALLFFRQREFLFPIPPVGRTSPQAAGFAQAEEDVLTSADGEKVIVWHVPAKSGRPVVLFFHGNGEGSRDPVIPIALGERLLALAHQPRQFVRFDGGGHNDLDNYGALEAARRFIDAAPG